MMTSGAEILATQIALGLDRDRFDSIICSTRSSAAGHVSQARLNGVEVLELGRRSKLDLWRFLPLIRLLRSGRVDVVHAHKFGSNFWSAALSPVAAAPVLVVHEHTWSFRGKPLRRLIDRELIARAATVFLAVSESDRQKMIEIERIPASKIRFVPNGIPDPQIGDARRARAKLGIEQGAPVVGTVCALRPQKALHVALDAVAGLIDEHPDLRFLVVGDGPERARLERQAAAQLHGRGMFLGRRSHAEIPDLIAAMDVLVCSSTFEGTPLAVLEWMAAGRAIVATHVGGIPSIIEDTSEGLLVPPNDAPALGAAVQRLLTDPTERQRLGANARRRQQAEFQLQRTLDVLQDLYEELFWSAPHTLRRRGAHVTPANTPEP